MPIILIRCLRWLTFLYNLPLCFIVALPGKSAHVSFYRFDQAAKSSGDVFVYLRNNPGIGFDIEMG